MPEGPEIRRAADQIATVLEGQIVTQIHFGLKQLKSFERKLQGSTIIRIKTRGKAMLTRFDNGLSLYSHNQLYGRWEVLQPGEISDSTRQLRIRIDTALGAALLYSASAIEVLTDTEVTTHPFLSKLGPDLFDPELSRETIQQRLLSPKFRNRQLGGFLTDQSFVAGLGNYLRCEILFLTRLPLSAKPTHCSEQQIEQLAEQILQLPRQSYRTGGITYIPEQAETLIEQGQTKEASRFWVFRRGGLPCRACGTAIEKRSGSGQPCYLCPSCQKTAI
ncbi:MAG: endonuclease VIII [Gammaproteobacteria bacterium]|nr:endonuclease VIII [Gammaproteobacteria bacterium]MBT4606064.1 endonuclease VIII [Thiotrichales bacterium]MBT3471883.1 endonuclease VIII [Gammaproteobacteria bacterium]MBT3967130.1 endonuclease VIII [Gammaproteobacteria bacterium]MBT4082026.1 endonuclease VIII [Gammaproteobacteria bacterium]